MAEWKAGDRVWVPGRGKAGTVTAWPTGKPIMDFRVPVRVDGDPSLSYYSPLFIRPLQDEPAPTDGDPASTYYDFPGGHAVRHISAHLSSFGGQVVQYVARSTRLDGRNKGDVVRDLKAARRLLDWEIERLSS